MVIDLLVGLYKVFKYFVYTCLLTGILFSGQCQRQYNQMCEATQICEPNYNRENRLFEPDERDPDDRMGLRYIDPRD